MCNSHKFGTTAAKQEAFKSFWQKENHRVCKVVVYTLKRITASTHKRNPDELVKSNPHNDSDAEPAGNNGRHVQGELLPVTAARSNVPAAAGNAGPGAGCG